MHYQASRLALSRRRLLVTTAALGAGAIVGARNARQVEANMGAMTFRLSEAEAAEIG